ncbi:hypothetical protein ACVWZL_002323 [Bradyrhizobium sp. GM2.4]
MPSANSWRMKRCRASDSQYTSKENCTRVRKRSSLSCRATSDRLRSVRSTTKETPWSRCSSNAAMPINTDTRLPSLRKYSFSNGCTLPIFFSSGIHHRSWRSSHSGGVRSVQRRRPETRSSRSYPTMLRNASLASRIEPSSSQMMIPMMLASTRRRILASRSPRSRYKAAFSSAIAACEASSFSTAIRAGATT